MLAGAIQYRTWILKPRTWDPMESGKSQLPCSQRLRLHRLTSSDLSLGPWSPCEPAYECAFTSAGGTKLETKSANGTGWRSAEATSVAPHALMALLLSRTLNPYLIPIISPRSSSTLPILNTCASSARGPPRWRRASKSMRKKWNV
jgi:hypothetical protein